MKEIFLTFNLNLKRRLVIEDVDTRHLDKLDDRARVSNLENSKVKYLGSIWKHHESTGKVVGSKVKYLGSI